LWICSRNIWQSRGCSRFPGSIARWTIAERFWIIRAEQGYPPFPALVNQSRGGMVPAGFAGESACLSILIGAFHRAISRISGIFGEVFETADWIEQTLPRKLGNGKNARG
jgi:hypothetical protein